MNIDKSNSRPQGCARTDDAEDPVSEYVRPSVEVNSLRLVTLGGSPGEGDSGATEVERVSG